jgi:superfamily II DNA helicase RecQ
MLDDWRIHSTHEFQLRVIHHITFQCNQLLHIIAKTGLGKSAIPQTIGSLQTGVTLSMVPLIGLGSDQVNKSQNNDNLIEAYHLDKHRGIDGKALRERLLSLHEQEANHVSIFLYALPQSLQVGTFWYQCLLTLSSCNVIWLIVIDEAHNVAQDGHSFRPEF